ATEGAAGEFVAADHAEAAGRAEEVVARVDRIRRRHAARRADPSLDWEPDLVGQQIDPVVPIDDIEAAEGADQAADRNAAAAVVLREPREQGLAPEQGEAQGPRLAEKPRLGEVDRVPVGARARLDVGREDLPAPEEIARRVRRLEKAALETRDSPAHLDLVAARLHSLHFDVDMLRLALRL